MPREYWLRYHVMCAWLMRFDYIWTEEDPQESRFERLWKFWYTYALEVKLTELLSCETSKALKLRILISLLRWVMHLCLKSNEYFESWISHSRQSKLWPMLAWGECLNALSTVYKTARKAKYRMLDRPQNGAHCIETSSSLSLLRRQTRAIIPKHRQWIDEWHHEPILAYAV